MSARESHWRDDARCLNAPDPELFFPHPRGAGGGDSGPQTKEAIEWCEFCPVKRQCLEFALDTNALGVWGGVHFPIHPGRRAVRQAEVRDQLTKETV